MGREDDSSEEDMHRIAILDGIETNDLEINKKKNKHGRNPNRRTKISWKFRVLINRYITNKKKEKQKFQEISKNMIFHEEIIEMENVGKKINKDLKIIRKELKY